MHRKTYPEKNDTEQFLSNKHFLGKFDYVFCILHFLRPLLWDLRHNDSLINKASLSFENAWVNLIIFRSIACVKNHKY